MGGRSGRSNAHWAAGRPVSGLTKIKDGAAVSAPNEGSSRAPERTKQERRAEEGTVLYILD